MINRLKALTPFFITTIISQRWLKGNKTVNVMSIEYKMLVDTWDEGIAELTGESESVAAGNKYYDVFPPLIFRDKDAVAFSIEKQRKLVLKRYIFNCLYSRVTADVMIEPVLTVNGMQGAAIKV